MRLLPALCALGALGVTAFGDGALSRFSGAVNKKDRGARARTPTASANATEEVRGGGVRATTIKYDKTDHIIDRAIRPVFAGVAAGLEAFTAASNEAAKTSVVIDVKAVPGDVHIIESESAQGEGTAALRASQPIALVAVKHHGRAQEGRRAGQVDAAQGIFVWAHSGGARRFMGHLRWWARAVRDCLSGLVCPEGSALGVIASSRAPSPNQTVVDKASIRHHHTRRLLHHAARLLNKCPS